MLKVTLAGGEGSYTAVVDHDDKKKAAEDFLALLVAEKDFFPENRIDTEFPSYITPDPGVYGVLMMPGECIDEDLHDNSWYVMVEEYKPGTLI